MCSEIDFCAQIGQIGAGSGWYEFLTRRWLLSVSELIPVKFFLFFLKFFHVLQRIVVFLFLYKNPCIWCVNVLVLFFFFFFCKYNFSGLCVRSLIFAKIGQIGAGSDWYEFLGHRCGLISVLELISVICFT